MWRKIINISSKIAHKLLPQHCVLCGAAAAESSLCTACTADLPWHDGALCPICALPSPTNSPCGVCLKAPPCFDATIAAFHYQFPLSSLLQQYKYAHSLILAESFSQLLQSRLTHRSMMPDLLIPMPLHPDRLRQRGFNQANEIARYLARRLRLPLDSDTCQRIQNTVSQARLPLEQRYDNLRGAFHCKPMPDNPRVALVDDIMTTGASLNELAKVVRQAGASHIECWVVARTLLH